MEYFYSFSKIIFFLLFFSENNLDVGRKKLIEDRNSERFKLETPDSNDLDVMFVDQRGKTWVPKIVKGTSILAVVCT